MGKTNQMMKSPSSFGCLHWTGNLDNCTVLLDTLVVIARSRLKVFEYWAPISVHQLFSSYFSFFRCLIRLVLQWRSALESFHFKHSHGTLQKSAHVASLRS